MPLLSLAFGMPSPDDIASMDTLYYTDSIYYLTAAAMIFRQATFDGNRFVEFIMKSTS